MDERNVVAAAVEALRQATVEGDGRVLCQILLDEVSFGHSNGRVEGKADLLDTLDGKAAFRSIRQSNERIAIVGETASVRHVFDAERNRPDGTVSCVHLAVLQVWVKRDGDWRLLARHASPLVQ